MMDDLTDRDLYVIFHKERRFTNYRIIIFIII